MCVRLCSGITSRVADVGWGGNGGQRRLPRGVLSWVLKEGQEFSRFVVGTSAQEHSFL